MTPAPAFAALQVANLRDLGGLRLVRNGGSVRGVIAPARLIRASSLSALSPEACAHLTSAVGPGDCFDLRSEREIERDGGLETLAALGWRWHRYAIEEVAQHGGASAGPNEDPYLAAARRTLDITPLGGPVFIGCSLGKDRTGRVIALLLSWFGADQSDIVADFLASNAQLSRETSILPARFRGKAGYAGVSESELLPWLHAQPRAPDALQSPLARFLIIDRPMTSAPA